MHPDLTTITEVEIVKPNSNLKAGLSPNLPGSYSITVLETHSNDVCVTQSKRQAVI